MSTQSPESFRIHSQDKTVLEALKYTAETRSIGTMIIVHGMAEHQLRYEAFARFMNENRFTVYTYDQRGHGKTAGELENVGFFADKDGHIKVKNDLLQLVHIVKKEHPDLPLILMGHSMGSFVCRNLVNEHSELIDGLILSGTATDQGFMGKVGIGLAGMIAFIMGAKHPSKLMNMLSFGEFNKPFKPNRTDFDWLSQDNAQVDAYINDPYCGSIFSARFFQDMLRLIQAANSPEKVKAIRKDLPILLVSGDKDPVGDFGKGVKKVQELYKAAGIQSVKLKLFAEGRHEMLNETNREEVFEFIAEAAENMFTTA